MECTYIPYFPAVIADIEGHLFEKQTVEDIARRYFISPMQLNRHFYSATGYSVNEYIRKRRLSDALAQIKASAFSLADIAHNCGYSSQQALCREIKETLHMTATAYKNGNACFFFPPYSRESYCQIAVAKNVIPLTRRLDYFHSKKTGLEDRAVQQFLVQNPTFTGRLFGRNGEQKNGLFCYELYAENNCEIHEEGFRPMGEVPSYTALFAVAGVHNQERHINMAWDYLYNRWLAQSTFLYAKQENDCFENRYFEEYLYKNGIVYRLKLHLPLIRRSDYTKITLETLPESRFIVAAARGCYAEHIASKAVVSYLNECYPYLLKNAQDFYVQRSGGQCTCGIKVNSNMKWIHSPLKTITLPAACFAVLQGKGLGYYEEYKQILLSWMKDTDLTAEGEPFAVYNTAAGYDNPSMQVLCRCIPPKPENM